MTLKEAIKAAKEWDKRLGSAKTIFVHREQDSRGHWIDDYDVIHQDDYYGGYGMGIPEQAVVWSTSEGYY